MLHRTIRHVVAVSALAALVGCGGGGAATDADALRSRLESAGEGDRVRLGRARIEASVEVPAGVTLVGDDRDASVIAAPEGEVGVRLGPGARLEGLTVEAGGTVGVYARDTTSAHLSDVTIRASRGAALLADGVDTLEITGSRFEGPILDEGPDAERFLEPDPTSMATHGLVLLGVGDAQLTELEVSGFAQFGAVVRDISSDGSATDARVTWQGGSVTETLGYGLYADGERTRVTLEAISIEQTHQGLRILPPYGAVSVGGARIESSDVAVRDNDRYGLLHMGAPAMHENLLATGNGDAALWVGESTDFELAGESTDVSGNAFAGVVVVDSTNVRLRDGSVAATATSRRNIGSGDVFGMVEVGDGVHMLGSGSEVVLEGIALEDNERTGLLVDLGADDGAGITFRDVLVRGTGEQLGAIAGTTDDPEQPSELTPAAPGGWDEGIVREGATVDNDPAFTDALDVAGAVSPSDLPAPSDIAGAVSPSD